jgi:HK97 family phage major capsid protein
VLEKDSNGNYIHGSSNDSETPRRLWGKTVITSQVIAQGTGIVGAFAEGAAIYGREQPRVDFSDSHSDLFTRNQIIFRGEERLQFAVFRHRVRHGHVPVGR